MKPQISKCSIDEHHANQAIGSTLLKILIQQTPAHYLYAEEHKEESTPAQAFGSAIHEAILEPCLFKDKMIVEPKFEGKGSREARETWHLENHGRTILKADQYEIIQGILKNISKHKQASKLISEGHAEESLLWIDPETQVPCKTRPDFKHEKHVLVNVKSTNDASAEACKMQIASYAYHIQAAMELDGASIVFDHEFDEYVYLFVEKLPPYGVNCFSLGFESIAEGRALKHKGLSLLKKCQESGKYPCYDDSKIHPIGLPTWAFRTEE